MTLRRRLTLLFAALLGAMGLVWSLGLIFGLAITLDTIAEEEVKAKVQQVQDYLRELHARQGQVRLESRAALPSAFSDDGMLLQICDAQGRPLNRSPNLKLGDLAAPSQPGLAHVNITLGDSPSRLVVATRVLVLPDGSATAWVQAALPLKSRDATLRGFVAWAVGSWVALVLVAFGVGHAFAARALAPVVAMADEVQRMQARDLHLRLQAPPKSRDEVEALAITFNGLLARLEAAFEARKRFVADASHELKSPLTGIRGALDLIRRRGEGRPAEVKAWATSAIAEVDRLGRLVASLLDLARSDELGLGLTREAVDLAPKLGQIVASYGQREGEAEPRVALRPLGPAVVLGDRDRLRQIFLNLLDNAVRATRDGGAVWVEFGPSPLPGQVRVSVVDEGVGIPQADLDRIFDRFTRLDAARDRGAGGHGLGLSIVRALVKAHGGDLQVHSAVGQGTRFDLDLPAA